MFLLVGNGTSCRLLHPRASTPTTKTRRPIHIPPYVNASGRAIKSKSSEGQSDFYSLLSFIAASFPNIPVNSNFYWIVPQLIALLVRCLQGYHQSTHEANSHKQLLQPIVDAHEN